MHLRIVKQSCLPEELLAFRGKGEEVGDDACQGVDSLVARTTRHDLVGDLWDLEASQWMAA